ncbi:hypothetical protein K431DRAFT_348079 [Polychaeton citri CBS 116435]|uniref:Uncharacterized protein n=1 Tax=Polychaeton citri CBS 116435 TaxID=1314669 RepID=A0A9P4Q6Z3_9PEZI|nr:hypothetical protein K431DRAFT_348079 [Polychaeton citri CBS 116435]
MTKPLVLTLEQSYSVQVRLARSSQSSRMPIGGMFEIITTILALGGGDADGAVRVVMKEALAVGVDFVQALVERLISDSQGSCIGIETTARDEITGQSILLWVGVWAARLIADSARENFRR